MAKQKYKFERLTPIDNMDLDVYEEAIDYVFSNSDVKNVAISGAYSAGKSSVLASYKKKHGELRFLHISLAHFKSTDQESDAEVKESTLEGKILNQLIHQIPSEKIPQTNFRVKKTVSSKSIATSTIGAVLFLISILHLLFFSVWKNYIGVLPVSLIKSILMPSTHPYALIVDGIIILVLLSLSVYKLIRIQREKNIFRKLNIKGNEIEIFEKSDDSYFDKYLNEVLYLFENADADVIVFEDMDRFNTNGIFERLREVNTLANIQLPAGYKKVPPNPESNTYTIRKENSRFNWNIHSDLNQRMQDLSNYHRKVRKDLFYIYGDTKLWYLKKNLPNNTHVLQRNSLTLIFAVMHWMSELVRYNPQKFEKLMESKQNWLLHEFIEKALYQFVDEISCEITHQEIMTTGYRK